MGYVYVLYIHTLLRALQNKVDAAARDEDLGLRYAIELRLRHYEDGQDLASKEEKDSLN